MGVHLLGLVIWGKLHNNYVVINQNWDAVAAGDVGATTLCNGTNGTTGVISSANSLVGSTAFDHLGNGGVTPLTNGNYVVSSSGWNSFAGAVTFGNGTTGIFGVVSSANSLVGSNFDNVGSVTALTNGNYVVSTSGWDSAAANVGAVTFGNGTTGTIGVVSQANSVVGSTANDQVGDGGITVLANGNYIVNSPRWDNVATTEAGAITYGAGNGGMNGTITADNSVRGTAGSGGFTQVYAFDTFNETLVVGRPNSNIVSIFNPTYTSVADGNWSSAATWDYGAFTNSHDVYVPNGRTVNLDVIDVVSSLRIDCTGAITGASSSAYIISNIRKDFCSTGAFTYPSGTANGFSPVNTNITALGSNPSSLTISATPTIHPNLSATNSLKRFWTLTESGDLTTDSR